MTKLSLVGVLVLLSTVGCSILSGSDDDSDDDDEGGAGVGADSGGGSGGGGSGKGGGGSGGAPARPHALGLITMGELHPGGGGTPRPSLSAIFVPDATAGGAAAPVCTRVVGSCEVVLTPECAGGCGTGRYCAFDAGCRSVCQDFCDLSCPEGEACYFASSGSPACGRIEHFDAGTLTFSGTTSPVTLLPPYSFTSDAQSSLYGSGARVTVRASGAAQAGFEAFEQAFTATDIVQTSPPLSSLGRAAAFGTGPLNVSWVAGRDDLSVAITLADTGGQRTTLICNADDASGGLSVPRATLTEAVEGRALSAVTVAVTRSRTERFEGFETVGELSSATVQPEGFLELVTTSSEVQVIDGCASGRAMCGDVCADVLTDRGNCGACGRACAASDWGCTSGACAPCGPGQVMCGGRCVDTSEDNANCGACSRACATGTECFASVCEACEGPCSTCPGGGYCDGRCVDFDTDVNNCGECLYDCETGQRCMGGECVAGCPSGRTDCSGTCVNVMTDIANCGACARRCTTGQTCTNGTCTGGGPTCGTGLEDCDGTCVNLDTDEDNCGDCGYQCNTGETCLDGACEVSCGSGLTNCDGFCVNLTNDEDNCGICGYPCYPGEECQAGECY